MDLEAVKCSFCKCSLGQCTSCRAWIVEGTRCVVCGRGTSVRATARAKAPKAPEPEDEPGFRFRASPFSLLAPLLARFLLVAAFLASTALALAAAGVRPVGRFLEAYVTLPKSDWKTLAGAAGLFLFLGGVAAHFVRRARWHGTWMNGGPIEVRFRPGAFVGDLVVSVLALAFTAGLGLPWVYARYRRSFFRSCFPRSAGGKAFDWDGSGEAVLGRFLLTLLLLPLVVGSAGLLTPLVSWTWVRWELRHLKVPDRNGIHHRARLTASFGAYFGRWVAGWLLSLVTLGVWRPWAKAAEWTWIAENLPFEATR
jgi:hypothetical protein